MTNEALAVSGTQTVSTKRKGGRPANPNAMKIRAPQLLERIWSNDLTKDTAIQTLISELGCKESSAMTFYYTFKAAKSKASQVSTETI
jgi:hypothetical protein